MVAVGGVGEARGTASGGRVDGTVGGRDGRDGATTSLSNTADHEAAQVAHVQTQTHTTPLTQLDLYAPAHPPSLLRLCAAAAKPPTDHLAVAGTCLPAVLGTARRSLGASRPPIRDRSTDRAVVALTLGIYVYSLDRSALAPNVQDISQFPRLRTDLPPHLDRRSQESSRFRRAISWGRPHPFPQSHLIPDNLLLTQRPSCSQQVESMLILS